MPLIWWLFENVLEVLIDDDRSSRSRTMVARRRGGVALLHFGAICLFFVAWMILGPSAGVSPYEGFRFLVRMADVVAWILLMISIVTTLYWNLAAWELRT